MIAYRLLGIAGVSSRVHFGLMPRVRNEMPSRSAIGCSAAKWRSSSASVSWTVASGAPESSNWPPGSIEIAPPPSSESR